MLARYPYSSFPAGLRWFLWVTEILGPLSRKHTAGLSPASNLLLMTIWPPECTSYRNDSISSGCGEREGYFESTGSSQPPSKSEMQYLETLLDCN